MTANTLLHRRRFLTGCLVASSLGWLRAPGALVSAAVVPVRVRRRFPLTLAMLTKSDFDPCVGTAFQMETAPEQSAPLELIEVSGYPPQAMRTGATREPFCLVFRGPKNLQVSQRIFRLTHPELGVQEIFLVPIGPDDRGMRLEAVFS